MSSLLLNKVSKGKIPSNIDIEERKALKALKKDSSITILPVDKARHRTKVPDILWGL